MDRSELPAAPPPAPRTVAAIDVGANSLRMVVAEVLPDGRIEILERLQRAVRLGQDTFRRGRLGGQSMRAAVAVLRDFRQILTLYKVERLRAVATSAVREAGNSDIFLNRVFMASGLNLEVIATTEESRLTVSAVRRAVGDALGVNQGSTLIAEVGGGSTLLTVLENGEIATSQSLRLGAIRLQEMLRTTEEPAERAADMLSYQIGNVISTSVVSLPLDEVTTFVAVGSDARFASRQVGKPTESGELYIVPLAALEKLVRKCERQSAEELGKRYGLPHVEAETLAPALLVYLDLIKRTKASEMIVSWVTMRDGLLLDLARSVTGEEDRSVVEGAVHSAWALAEKYRTNPQHAETVAELALRLFDALQADHGLAPRHRLLLRLAALLHEVGAYVSNAAHHKHSYYLIKNSEVFGLTRDEIELVAHVARYHRRSGPKPSHVEYMSLPRESRLVVNKLAALLRVADALSRGRAPQVRNPRLERNGDELRIFVSNVTDLALERRALAAKGDMFEDVYGMRIRLEEAGE